MLEFKPQRQSRSRLYYGKYQYCLVFRFEHASFLRTLNHKLIDQAVTYRNMWKLGRPSWLSAVSAEQKSDLHVMCDYLLSKGSSHKRVISGNGIWIYTNDLACWQDIKQNTSNVHYHFSSEAVVCLPPDAVVLKHPKHQFRTYFKNCWFNTDQLDSIRKYFLSRRDQFQASPSFHNFLIGQRQWISNYNFVDHNDAKIELFINLACPGIVSKTMPIVACDK